jgi:hypothetical protein
MTIVTIQIHIGIYCYWWMKKKKKQETNTTLTAAREPGSQGAREPGRDQEPGEEEERRESASC